MPSVFEVADLLVSRAVASHGDDIDLVAYYGSHARGTARADSDLDLFYVPREGTDPPVGRTFLLHGRLFDFWAIPWTALEAFATGRTRGWAFAPAIVHHAKTLHARDDQASARLARVKQLTLDLQEPEARPPMIRRALDAFGRVSADLENVRRASRGGALAEVRFAGWELIRSTIECLALANQTFFHGGLGAALGELGRLAHRPSDLEERVALIVTSSEPVRIVEAGVELTASTRHVLLRLQETLPPNRSVGERFRQAYPEIRDMVSKLLAACESGEPLAIGAAAWVLQSDVSRMLGETGSGPGHAGFNLLRELSGAYAALGLPDLLGAPSEELTGRARALDRRLRRWLQDRSVDLSEFETLQDLRDSLAIA